MNKLDRFGSIPIKFRTEVPDGYVVLTGTRQGQGTADQSEQYGVVMRPDGVCVSYVIRDGKVIFT